VERAYHFVCVIVAAAVIACGGHKSPSNEPGRGSAVQPDGDDTEADEHIHRRAGIPLYIEISLEKIDITQQQNEALKKIRRELHDKMLPAHNAENAIIHGLVDGIKAGAIDAPQLAKLIDELETAVAGFHDAVADSLDELHATLDPEQRKKLVAEVERHFRIWHKAHAQDPGAHDRTGGHLARLAKQLALTDQQVATIDASFEKSIRDMPAFDRAKAKAHVDAFAGAFESDQFNARAILQGEDSNMATWGITRTVRFYEAVVPTLTPEQRAKLAELVRHHAT
jgi:Spy/CpxP family protein refolding chaperone